MSLQSSDDVRRRTMKNAKSLSAYPGRDTFIFQAAAMLIPAVSAWIAFSRSAEVHALNVLLGQGACGNLLMTPDLPVIFGHCFRCWSAGAAAGVVAFLVVTGARKFSAHATGYLQRAD